MNHACAECGGPVSRTSASRMCQECRFGARFNATESNRAMVRALRRYAEKHQPGAAWLQETA